MNIEDNKEELTSAEKAKTKKIETLLAYYQNNIKVTYACCSLITTISKEHIFLPVNEYDIYRKS